MPGRKPKKVFVYNEDGSYICTFLNINEFRTVYFPKDVGKRPLFINKVRDIPYEHIRDASVIAYLERVYRDDTIYNLAIINSEFCKKQDKEDNRAVQVFNLENELIAEFKNARLCKKLMTNINQSTISRQLKSDHKNKVNHSELKFKYKDNNE